MDFRGSLDDPADPQATEPVLDGQFATDAEAAEHLQGPIDRLEGPFGAEELGRRSVIAGIFTALGLGMMLLAHAAPMTGFLDRVPFAIFVLPGADVVARPWFEFAGAILLFGALFDAWQEWVRVEPAPDAAAARVAR